MANHQSYWSEASSCINMDEVLIYQRRQISRSMTRSTWEKWHGERTNQRVSLKLRPPISADGYRKQLRCGCERDLLGERRWETSLGSVEKKGDDKWNKCTFLHKRNVSLCAAETFRGTLKNSIFTKVVLTCLWRVLWLLGCSGRLLGNCFTTQFKLAPLVEPLLLLSGCSNKQNNVLHHFRQIKHIYLLIKIKKHQSLEKVGFTKKNTIFSLST